MEEYETEDESEYQSLDQFYISKKIGRGQFAEVFEAVCIEDGKTVAIKRIHSNDMGDSSARIDCLKEIKLLQQLKHVNIIGYLGSFTSSSQLHIVLELADAGDLSRLIKHFRRQRKLILEQTVWKYFVQVCSAIDHMHSKRIMHRDIKPANIFITSEGIVKLGDLGLGRYFSHKTFAAKSLVGTPYYMSPERVSEQEYNFASDIWSMGCLLYEYRRLVHACIRPDPLDRPNITRVYSISKQMNNLFAKGNPPSNYYSHTSEGTSGKKPYSFANQ